jgi:hypothetical protein
MSLSSLLNQVIAITNRPELENRIILAIQKATLKEHAALEYTRDLVISTPIDLTPSDVYRYSIDRTAAPLVRLRKVNTIREVVNPSIAYQSYSGFYGEIEFTESALDNIFDEYNVEKRNYYYRQGNLINLVAMRQINQVTISYYQVPDVNVATYSSWIADEYDYLIYDAASAEIFGSIGNNQEHNTYLQKAMMDRIDVAKYEINNIS